MTLIRFSRDGNVAPAANSNDGFTGQIAQEFLHKTAIKKAEPMLYFYRAGKSPEVVNGYATQSFLRVQQIPTSSFTETTGGENINVAVTTSTPSDYVVGTSPSNTNVPVGTISVQPRQFVMTTQISDMIVQFSPFNYAEAVAELQGDAAGRRIDMHTQDTIYNHFITRSGNITYAGTVTAINSFTTSNTSTTGMTLGLIADAEAILAGRNAPKYPNLNQTYLCIMHTNPFNDIRKSTANNAWLDIAKNTPEGVGRIWKGTIVMIHGVTIMVTQFVNTKQSTGTGTPTVYPTYVFGYGCFGCLKYRMSTYRIPYSQVDSNDPAGQKEFISTNFVYNCIVLDSDYCQIILSQATLSVPSRA